MNRARITKVGLARAGVILSAAALLGTFATAGAGASQAQKKKHLSLANVTITNPTSGIGVPDWISEGQKFFQQQGLNVTVTNSTASSADLTALLVSGGTNFLMISSSAQMIAAQGGAPIRAVFQAETSATQEIVLTQSFAAAHNISATGSTAAGALAQFLALKGTHANIAVSNSSAEGYAWMKALAAQHAMTVGTGGTTADFNLISDGSPANEVAAFSSGKVDGFSNTPPTTVVSSPPSITISLYRIAPTNKTAGVYMTTNTTMIQKHSDTVQAMVNAETEAEVFAIKHPVQAQKDASAVWATLQITSPEEVDYLFHTGFIQFDKNPIPTKKAYDIEASLINSAGITTLNLPASTFLVPKFATAAVKQYGSPTGS